jgi:hypothetical protein
MRKTFCDTCGTECVNTVVQVNVTTMHQTQDGIHAGVDEYKPAELCVGCGDKLKAFLPMKLIQQMEYAENTMNRDGPYQETARAVEPQ